MRLAVTGFAASLRAAVSVHPALCRVGSSPRGRLEPPWLYAGGTQGLQEVTNVLTSRHTSPFLQLTFVSALVLEKAEGKAGTPGLM